MKNILIKVLCYFEYRKIYAGVSQLINNNPRKSIQNDEHLINRYAKILYNSKLISDYTELKFYKKTDYLSKLKMKFIKLKYNAFNLVELKKSDKHVITDYLIDVLIKLLSKLKGFNKPLEFDTVSDKLNGVEKWAIDVTREEKAVPRGRSDFEKLVIKKEKEIAKDFYFGINHRDDEEDFVKDIERIATARISRIKGDQILFKMDETGEFYKNYSKNDVKPKRKIFFIEYFKNLRNRFESKWNAAKEKRAKVVLSNMKKRLEIIKFNTFKKNLGNLEDEHVSALYKAVDLNKRVMSIR